MKITKKNSLLEVSQGQRKQEDFSCKYQKINFKIEIKINNYHLINL